MMFSRHKHTYFIAILSSILFLSIPNAWSAGNDVIGDNLIWLAIILLAAQLFGSLVEKLGLPSVLGELLLGVLLGNAILLNIDYFIPMSKDPILSFIAEMGVIILLFQIGMETRLQDLVKVGWHASVVAAIGVILPFMLGAFFVGPYLLPELHEASSNPNHTYLFLGATLAATSVGITGRVFRDLNQLNSPEARIVLGAAVIDDILGLIILAIVSSLVKDGVVGTAAVTLIIGKSFLFLVLAIGLGRLLAPLTSKCLARLDNSHSMLFALIMATALLLAWLAHQAGLADIVGAFAAGLLFEPAIFNRFETPRIVQEIQPLIQQEADGPFKKLQIILDRYTLRQHEDIIEPIGFFFVPVFFVLTGMHVDLTSFANTKILIVAIGVTLAAIVGKIAAGFFVGKKTANPWIIGWGMVPRGEVGLIFAMTGNKLGVISETIFSVIVMMVIFTTLLTPPILTFLLKRQNKKSKIMALGTQSTITLNQHIQQEAVIIRTNEGQKNNE